MPQHEHTLPVPARMSRVAVVAPQARLREALVTVADAGVVELAGTLPSPDGEKLEALRRVERATPGRAVTELRLAPGVPDVAELERARRRGPARRRGRARASRRGRGPHGSFAVAGRLGAERRGSQPLSRDSPRPGAVARRAARVPRGSSRRRCSRRAPLERPFRPLVDDIRGRPLRRHRPDALRGRLVRPHVRDDVRRRRARPRARRCARAAAAPRTQRPVSPASGISGRFRSLPASPAAVLRPALRRALRPDGGRADALARARSTGPCRCSSRRRRSRERSCWPSATLIGIAEPLARERAPQRAVVAQSGDRRD